MFIWVVKFFVLVMGFKVFIDLVVLKKDVGFGFSLVPYLFIFKKFAFFHI